MARELKRLNTNMPVELVDRIDAYAEKMCINRSSAINVLCSLALDQQSGLKTLEDLMTAYKSEKNILENKEMEMESR